MPAKTLLRRSGQFLLAAARRLETRLDTSVAYIHMPKCGGTSLHQAIARYYPEPKVSYLDPTASGQAAAHLSRDLLPYRRDLLAYELARTDRPRFVSGHWPVDPEMMASVADDWAFVTLLRHPVDRWLSNYFFNRHRAENRDHFGTDLGLADYLDTADAAKNGKLFVSFCTGGQFEGAEDEQTIQQAIAVLKRFTLVGFLEDMDAFGQAFQKRFGVPLETEALNRNPASMAERDAELTQPLRDRIEALCAPDLALYEALREHVSR
ncbi:MAG: hypothetical protein AAGK23_10210 [Pseudomonadota bacterium]